MGTTSRLVYQTQDYMAQQVSELRAARELTHEAVERWPVAEVPSIESFVSCRTSDHYGALLEREQGVAEIGVSGGTMRVVAYGGSPAAAAALIEAVRAEVPRAEDDDPDLVPVTFWALGSHGPQSVRRMIDAPAFESIEDNYPGAGELLSLLNDWEPGVGGQLLLWHGDAGTGKTTALRSLGREWSEWAELHYIVDPDKFFGESASYMISVMMGGELPVDGGGEKVGARPRWRVLVLEDCAEMLAPDARRDVGQALSRLLNACDGLIGRGLRLLILITTNEPLEKVHPAIARPGRCASRIEFERFEPFAAAGWLERAGQPLDPSGPGLAGALTLADLYARRDGHRSENGRQPVGFTAG
jgi:hypothetical protein